MGGHGVDAVGCGHLGQDAPGTSRHGGDDRSPGSPSDQAVDLHPGGGSYLGSADVGGDQRLAEDTHVHQYHFAAEDFDAPLEEAVFRSLGVEGPDQRDCWHRVSRGGALPHPTMLDNRLTMIRDDQGPRQPESTPWWTAAVERRRVEAVASLRRRRPRAAVTADRPRA